MYNCNTDSLGLILGVEVFFSDGHCSGALWGPLKLFLGNNIWKCKVHFSFWIKLISFYIRVILQFSQKLKRISMLAVWMRIILWISLIHDKYVEKYFLSAIETVDIW